MSMVTREIDDSYEPTRLSTRNWRESALRVVRKALSWILRQGDSKVEEASDTITETINGVRPSGQRK